MLREEEEWMPMRREALSPGEGQLPEQEAHTLTLFLESLPKGLEGSEAWRPAAAARRPGWR